MLRPVVQPQSMASCGVGVYLSSVGEPPFYCFVCVHAAVFMSALWAASGVPSGLMRLYVCYHGIDLSPGCLLKQAAVTQAYSWCVTDKGCMQVGHASRALLSTCISLSIHPPANRHVHVHADYPSWTVVEDQWTLYMAPNSTSYHYC